MRRSPQAILTLFSIALVSVAVDKVAKTTLRKRNRRQKQAPAADESAADVFTPLLEAAVKNKAGMDINDTVIVHAVNEEDSIQDAAVLDAVVDGHSGQMGWQLLLLHALAALQHLIIFCASFAVSAVFWPFSSITLIALFLAGPIFLDLHSKWSRALNDALRQSIAETPIKAWDQTCI